MERRTKEQRGIGRVSGEEAIKEQLLSEAILRAMLEALNELEGEDGPSACWVKAVPRPHVGLLPSFLYGCFTRERGDEEALVLAGAAVELLYHSATIFDDIQDSSEVRYGLPAAWKLYGKERAINIGVWLLSASNLIVSGPRMPSDIAVLAVAAVNRAVGNMTRGQWSDLTLARPDLLQCMALSGQKTGALIAAGLQLGAIAARVPIDRHTVLLDAGSRLGEALQLHDDLEDLIDRFAVGGLRWTSAVAAVYPHLPEEARSELNNAMARSDARQFTSILADHGASQMLFSLSAASAAAARKLLGYAGLQKQSVDSLYTLLGLHRM